MKSMVAPWEIVDAIEVAADIAYKQYTAHKEWCNDLHPCINDDPVLDLLKANYELWQKMIVPARNAALSQYQANKASINPIGWLKDNGGKQDDEL